MAGENNPSFLEQGTVNEKRARVNSSGEVLINGVVSVSNPTANPETGLATSAKQDTLATKIDSLLTELQLKTEPNDIQMGEIIPMLRSILTAIANPAYVDKSTNQMRAQVTGSVTATVASTALTTIDGYNGKLLMVGINSDAWANTCRRLIT